MARWLGPYPTIFSAPIQEFVGPYPIPMLGSRPTKILDPIQGNYRIGSNSGKGYKCREKRDDQ